MPTIDFAQQRRPFRTYGEIFDDCLNLVMYISPSEKSPGRRFEKFGEFAEGQRSTPAVVPDWRKCPAAAQDAAVSIRSRTGSEPGLISILSYKIWVRLGCGSAKILLDFARTRGPRINNLRRIQGLNPIAKVEVAGSNPVSRSKIPSRPGDGSLKSGC